MANQPVDEEAGIGPALSYQIQRTNSRPSNRKGTPPPRDELNIPIQRRPARAAGSARSSIQDPPNDDELDVDRPEKWIWTHYGQHLVTKVKPWPFMSSKQGEESFEVNLAEVQRMYLVQLRIRLARHIGQWEKTGELHRLIPGSTDAVQGLQDYDDMDKRNQQSSSDPFRMTGGKKLDRIILEAAIGEATQRQFRGRHARDVRKWDSHMSAVVPSRTENRYRNLLSRLLVSAVGAGFLIGPMSLMILETGLYVALISTTVFVTIFGALVACFLDEHIHVLSTTAAYAAVLVVFVGLTSEANRAQE
ncbi:predicted protein [Chaetomium globosum CBS 148.51]|uniref:DUF6594 domain-containing protein n=1 Tax=Chaetomium globosum (strain ATCC 6205 / CBS 148.51 / DSM 1962 / NBRC 6347 / NRRL 1970) TaxID=306901 RepID=Q2GR55_CHAGB|nr:uncharacterized protein CHGG_09549 [Chaetomium globosum CBS 148.51]EAQ85535.1 predicted protein [Chaetomium globosum CBS 148.51]